MSHLTYQALFYLYIMGMGMVIAAKLLFLYRQTGSRLAKYLGWSYVWNGGGCYLALSTTVLFFAHDPDTVKWYAGILGVIPFYVGMAYTIKALTYLFPKLPERPLYGLVAAAAAVSLTVNHLYYQPKGIIPGSGVLDLNLPAPAMAIMSALMLTVMGGVAIGFVYYSLKRRVYGAGLGLGVGFLVLILFIPLTHQVTTWGAYLFFSVLASLGITTVAISVVLHPLLRGKSKRK